MKFIIKIYLILFFSTQVVLGQEKLSEYAFRVQHAYKELKKVPHAAILQIKYIQIFPDNKVDFINIFNAHTGYELSEKGVDYIKTFRKLGYDYPDSVLPKSIKIGKDLNTWSLGPVNELQKTIYYITGKNPQLFVDIVRELKKEEQISLAKFLHAGEKGKNINYDNLLQIFTKAGEKKLLKIFTMVDKEPQNDE